MVSDVMFGFGEIWSHRASTSSESTRPFVVAIFVDCAVSTRSRQRCRGLGGTAAQLTELA